MVSDRRLPPNEPSYEVQSAIANKGAQLEPSGTPFKLPEPLTAGDKQNAINQFGNYGYSADVHVQEITLDGGKNILLASRPQSDDPERVRNFAVAFTNANGELIVANYDRGNPSVGVGPTFYVNGMREDGSSAVRGQDPIDLAAAFAQSREIISQAAGHMAQNPGTYPGHKDDFTVFQQIMQQQIAEKQQITQAPPAPPAAPQSPAVSASPQTNANDEIQQIIDQTYKGSDRAPAVAFRGPNNTVVTAVYNYDNDDLMITVNDIEGKPVKGLTAADNQKILEDSRRELTTAIEDRIDGDPNNGRRNSLLKDTMLNNLRQNTDHYINNWPITPEGVPFPLPDQRGVTPSDPASSARPAGGTLSVDDTLITTRPFEIEPLVLSGRQPKPGDSASDLIHTKDVKTTPAEFIARDLARLSGGNSDQFVIHDTDGRLAINEDDLIETLPTKMLPILDQHAIGFESKDGQHLVTAKYNVGTNKLEINVMGADGVKIEGLDQIDADRLREEAQQQMLASLEADVSGYKEYQRDRYNMLLEGIKGEPNVQFQNLLNSKGPMPIPAELEVVGRPAPAPASLTPIFDQVCNGFYSGTQPGCGAEHEGGAITFAAGEPHAPAAVSEIISPQVEAPTQTTPAVPAPSSTPAAPPPPSSATPVAVESTSTTLSRQENPQFDPKVKEAQEQMALVAGKLGIKPEDLKLGTSNNPRGNDGLFGPKTEAAVIAVQEKMGMEATGKITPEFMDAMETRLTALLSNAPTTPLTARPISLELTLLDLMSPRPGTSQGAILYQGTGVPLSRAMERSGLNDTPVTRIDPVTGHVSLTMSASEILDPKQPVQPQQPMVSPVGSPAPQNYSMSS